MPIARRLPRGASRRIPVQLCSSPAARRVASDASIGTPDLLRSRIGPGASTRQAATRIGPDLARRAPRGHSLCADRLGWCGAPRPRLPGYNHGSVAREIISGRNWRNLNVLVVLAVLLVGNLTFHLEVRLPARATMTLFLWARPISNAPETTRLPSTVLQYAKAVAVAVAAYALSPIDLIPDFIPILGHVDDLLIVPAGIFLAVKLIPPEIMSEHRAGGIPSRTPALQPRSRSRHHRDLDRLCGAADLGLLADGGSVRLICDNG